MDMAVTGITMERFNDPNDLLLCILAFSAIFICWNKLSPLAARQSQLFYNHHI